MRLSILICTIPKRAQMLISLCNDLNMQIPSDDIVEVLVDASEYDTIGEKRNRLVKNATGKYLAFCDDDDSICADYIFLILAALKNNPDCCSLKGLITFNGFQPKVFIHSIRYKNYYEEDGIYYRPPNHLNAIRSEIAKQFLFSENNFGEDTNWAMQICNSGLLKTEEWIDPILYYYKFVQNK